MLKLLKVALCSALFVVGSNASDFLAKATNGITSDNDFGVKKLNDSEMNNIKGGYVVGTAVVAKNFAIAVAMPHDLYELGAARNKNTGELDGLYSDVTRGICDMGVTECYINKETYTHSQRSVNRLLEYTQALGPYTMKDGYLLAYTVQRNVIVDRNGNRNPYFSYGTAAYHVGKQTIHPITSSFNLENTIIKELINGYKNNLENELNRFARNLGW